MAPTATSIEQVIGRRASRRVACSSVVEIRHAGGEWIRAQLKDLSETGCRLTRAGNPATGGSLWLRLGGLDPIAARVRWTAADAFGCEFLLPLPEAARDELRRLRDKRGGAIDWPVAPNPANAPTKELACHSL